MTESWASSSGVARSMRSNTRRDTTLELRTRRELHHRGLRFRVDYAPWQWKRHRADIVFTRARVAVFLDGCFWHGCPIHYVSPVRNADYWKTKVEANRARDTKTSALLEREGWTVLRFWEHQSLDQVVGQIAEAVETAGESDG